MSIIERIIAIMEYKKLKYSDLANFLNINKSVVSTWKKRKTNPPAELLVQICNFLQVSLNFLITGEEYEMNLALDKNEEYIINLYRQLNDRNKIKLEGYIEDKIIDQKQNEQKNKNIISTEILKEISTPV